MILNPILSYNIIEDARLNGKKAKDINSLLYLIMHQAQDGRVLRVHYSEMCTALNMCRQTFYTTIRNLRDYGYITYKRSRDCKNGYYDFTVLNNDYEMKPSLKDGKDIVKIHFSGEKKTKGHIYLNRKFFDTNNLLLHKTNEIKAALYLVTINKSRMTTLKPKTLMKALKVNSIYVTMAYIKSVAHQVSDEEKIESALTLQDPDVPNNKIASFDFKFDKKAKTLDRKLMQLWLKKKSKDKIRTRLTDLRREHNVNAITEMIFKVSLDHGYLACHTINHRLSRAKTTLTRFVNDIGESINKNVEYVEYLF
jgi:hypothetical protein